MFTLLFHKQFKFVCLRCIFGPLCLNLLFRMWAYQCLAVKLVYLSTPPSATLLSWPRLVSYDLWLKAGLSSGVVNNVSERSLQQPQSFSLTCSSICMRASRSLSSCCRSSSISLLSSSIFSSSSVSGDPIPSSFSSARLLLGDEPLNSWRDMHS